MTTKTRTRPVIRSGSESGPHRRTLVDERSGLVIDISQNGPDERPSIYIELYPWASGYAVDVQNAPGHHPALVVTRYKPTDEAVS